MFRSLLCTLLLTVASLCQAQPAYLDPSFHGTGLRLMGFSGYENYWQAAALRPDGRIILAGGIESTMSTPKWNWLLTRLHPDGTTDSSFGQNGYVTTVVSPYDDGPGGVALDTAGRIVVAGASSHSSLNRYWTFGRYLPDGRPDSTFSGDGLLTTDGWLNWGYPTQVVVQADGKILISGDVLDTTHFTQFCLVRLLPDGTPDSSFGVGGLLVQHFGPQLGRAFAVSLLPDGRILAAGSADNYGRDFVLGRYLPDGRPDTTFGQQGFVRTDLGSTNEWVHALLVQPDGRILIAGNTTLSSGFCYGMARYLPDGAPDTSFGTGGLVLLCPAGLEQISAAGLLSDGRIIVGGTCDSLVSGQWVPHMVLYRHLPDGTPDTTWDGDGRVLTGLLPLHAGIAALLVQPDDRVVSLGHGLDKTLYRLQAAVARYLMTALPVSVREVPSGLLPRAIPNPARERVTLSWTQARTGPVTIRLTDAAGRVLRTWTRETVPAGPVAEHLALPAGLPGGIYFITLLVPDGQGSVRFVKE